MMVQVFTDPKIKPIRFVYLWLPYNLVESLFNLGKDQIDHTMARHLSIIISTKEEKFKENYVRIKKLYNIRNSIFYGGEFKGDLIQDCLDLSDIVRKAI